MRKHTDDMSDEDYEYFMLNAGQLCETIQECALSKSLLMCRTCAGWTVHVYLRDRVSKTYCYVECKRCNNFADSGDALEQSWLARRSIDAPASS